MPTYLNTNNGQIVTEIDPYAPPGTYVPQIDYRGDVINAAEPIELPVQNYTQETGIELPSYMDYPKYEYDYRGDVISAAEPIEITSQGNTIVPYESRKPVFDEYGNVKNSTASLGITAAATIADKGFGALANRGIGRWNGYNYGNNRNLNQDVRNYVWGDISKDPGLNLVGNLAGFNDKPLEQAKQNVFKTNSLNNDSLIDDYRNYTPDQKVDTSKIKWGKSFLPSTAGLSSFAKGFKNGFQYSGGNIWAGLFSGIGGVGANMINDATAGNRARKYNKAVDNSTNRSVYNFGQQANNISQYNKLNEMRQMAEGGDLSNMISVNEGGSHEQNPYGGVPLLQQGDVLTTVEEGEKIVKIDGQDYVFSDRLVVPTKIKKENKWKGDTFAEVADYINKEAEERPNDPISKNGINSAMSVLRDAQEQKKLEKRQRELKKQIGQMGPDQLSAMEQMMGGEQLPPEAQDMQGQYGQEMAQPSPEEQAMMDQQMEQEVPMEGEVPPEEMMEEEVPMANGGRIRKLAEGDPVDLYGRYYVPEHAEGNIYTIDGVPVTYDKLQELIKEDGNYIFNSTRSQGQYIPELDNEGHVKYDDNGNEIKKWVVTPSYNYVTKTIQQKANPTWMEKVPLFESLGSVVSDELGLTNNPDYTFSNDLRRASRIGATVKPVNSYYNPRFLDATAAYNSILQNNAAIRSAIRNSSGKNAASMRANTIASDANMTEQLGKAMEMQANLNNNQRKAIADNYNAVSVPYMNQLASVSQSNAANRLTADNYWMTANNAIDTAASTGRSTNRTVASTNWGNYGRENRNLNMLMNRPDLYQYFQKSNGEIGWGAGNEDKNK